MQDEVKIKSLRVDELSLLRSRVAEMEAALIQSGIVKRRLQLVNFKKKGSPHVGRPG